MALLVAYNLIVPCPVDAQGRAADDFSSVFYSPIICARPWRHMAHIVIVVGGRRGAERAADLSMYTRRIRDGLARDNSRRTTVIVATRQIVISSVAYSLMYSYCNRAIRLWRLIIILLYSLRHCRGHYAWQQRLQILYVYTPQRCYNILMC